MLENAMSVPEVAFASNLIKLFSIEAYQHCVDVASLVEPIIENDDSFSDEEKLEIVKGALLHDIGKIFVPFNLPSAPKKLDRVEFSLVKTHTQIGYEILKNNFSEIVCNIALYHHEQPNGGGYVEELPLSMIPKEALIVQVADVYDALISERTYKTGYEPEVALQIMKNDSRNLKLDDDYLRRLALYIKNTKK